MARRVSLPSADELFRATEDGEDDDARGGAGKPSKRGTVHVVPDQPRWSTSASTSASRSASSSVRPRPTTSRRPAPSRAAGSGTTRR